MPLFQPTNITPSTLGAVGNGTVDAANGFTVSWQVNGNAPMTAYEVKIMENDTASTLLFDTGKTSLDAPFYGTDEKGNPVFFQREITASELSAAGIRNGKTYKLLISQWWSETDSVTQQSASVFLCRSTPTLQIVNQSPSWWPSIGSTGIVISSNVCAFTANYAQEQGDAVAFVRWVLEIPNSNYVVDDTGNIPTAKFRYTYDGLFNGIRYQVRCIVETVNGVQITAQFSFTTVYFTTALQTALETGVIPDSSGVQVRWNSILPNLPRTNYLTTDDVYGALKLSGTDPHMAGYMTWNVKNPSAERAKAMGGCSLFWRGQYLAAGKEIGVERTFLSANCEYLGDEPLFLNAPRTDYENMYFSGSVFLGSTIIALAYNKKTGKRGVVRSTFQGRQGWAFVQLPDLADSSDSKATYSCIATDGSRIVILSAEYTQTTSAGAPFVYSDDQGITWKSGTMPDYTPAAASGNNYKNTWSCIAYGGGMWVAMCNGNSSGVAYSEDGVNWTMGSLADARLSSNFCSIAYNGNMFVAVGGAQSGTGGPDSPVVAGNTVYRYSKDGKVWYGYLMDDQKYGDDINSACSKILVGPENRFYAFVTKRSNGIGMMDNNKAVYCFVSDGTPGEFGLTWKAHRLPLNIVTADYSNGKFIATTYVSYGDGENGAGQYLISEDGVNWESHDFPFYADTELGNVTGCYDVLCFQSGWLFQSVYWLQAFFAPDAFSCFGAYKAVSQFSVEMQMVPKGESGATSYENAEYRIVSPANTAPVAGVNGISGASFSFKDENTVSILASVGTAYAQTDGADARSAAFQLPPYRILSITLRVLPDESQTVHAVWAGYGSASLDNQMTWADANTFFCVNPYDKWTNAGLIDTDVSGYVVYREETDSFNLKRVAEVGMNCTELTDCSVRTGVPYRYRLVPVDNQGIAPDAISTRTPITPCFWDWTILSCSEREDGSYLPKEIYRFSMNVTSGNISNNGKTNVSETFTQYPTVQRSPANYKGGTLSGYIGRLNKNHEYFDTRQLRDALYALSTTNNTLFLKNRKGDLWKIAISDAISVQTQDNTRQQAQIAAIPWVEIGDASNAKIFFTPDSSA